MRRGRRGETEVKNFKEMTGMIEMEGLKFSSKG